MSFNQYNQNGIRKVGAQGLRAVSELPAFEGCSVDRIKSTGGVLVEHRLDGIRARVVVTAGGGGGCWIANYPGRHRAYWIVDGRELVLVVARWKQSHNLAAAVKAVN